MGNQPDSPKPVIGAGNAPAAQGEMRASRGLAKLPVENTSSRPLAVHVGLVFHCFPVSIRLAGPPGIRSGVTGMMYRWQPSAASREKASVRPSGENDGLRSPASTRAESVNCLDWPVST